jgi:hypothetical protein
MSTFHPHHQLHWNADAGDDETVVETFLK